MSIRGNSSLNIKFTLADMLLNISNCYEGPHQSVPRSFHYAYFVLMQLTDCNRLYIPIFDPIQNRIHGRQMRPTRYLAPPLSPPFSSTPSLPPLSLPSPYTIPGGVGCRKGAFW